LIGTCGGPSYGEDVALEPVRSPLKKSARRSLELNL
jgi:hypothetical protein